MTTDGNALGPFDSTSQLFKAVRLAPGTKPRRVTRVQAPPPQTCPRVWRSSVMAEPLDESGRCCKLSLSLPTPNAVYFVWKYQYYCCFTAVCVPADSSPRQARGWSAPVLRYIYKLHSCGCSSVKKWARALKSIVALEERRVGEEKEKRTPGTPSHRRHPPSR